MILIEVNFLVTRHYSRVLNTNVALTTITYKKFHMIKPHSQSKTKHNKANFNTQDDHFNCITH